MEKDEDTNGLEGRGKFLAMRKTKEFRQQQKKITKGMIVPSFLRPGFILIDHALGAQGLGPHGANDPFNMTCGLEDSCMQNN